MYSWNVSQPNTDEHWTVFIQYGMLLYSRLLLLLGLIYLPFLYLIKINTVRFFCKLCYSTVYCIYAQEYNRSYCTVYNVCSWSYMIIIAIIIITLKTYIRKLKHVETSQQILLLNGWIMVHLVHTNHCSCLRALKIRMQFSWDYTNVFMVVAILSLLYNICTS